MADPLTFARDDGETIAYRRLVGRGPGILWLGGFHSDMTGSKAQALSQWATREGRALSFSLAATYSMSVVVESTPGIGRTLVPSIGQIPQFPSGPRTAALRPSGDNWPPAVPSGVTGFESPDAMSIM